MGEPIEEATSAVESHDVGCAIHIADEIPTESAQDASAEPRRVEAVTVVLSADAPEEVARVDELAEKTATSQVATDSESEKPHEGARG